jgi:hypothetical protein
MKKTLFWMILLLALLQVAAAEGPDAKISWTLPTSYANGTPIDPADVQKIVVMVYSGLRGTVHGVGLLPCRGHFHDGSCSSSGQTLWYTAKSSLQEQIANARFPCANKFFHPDHPMIKRSRK